jgi:hypothetical protein
MGLINIYADFLCWHLEVLGCERQSRHVDISEADAHYMYLKVSYFLYSIPPTFVSTLFITYTLGFHARRVPYETQHSRLHLVLRSEVSLKAFIIALV